ncbi:MAG TPA: response regulator, partial [Motiliproteus sp.]
MMKRVLLVEDSPMMAKVMTYMLRQELQVTPVVTTTLAETREYFEQGALADVDHIAAIVDLHLPDAPNGEALDYVLSQGIPVIVLTASDDQAQRDTILKKGVVDYMVKEGRFAYEYVVRLVRRLDQNRHMHVLVVDDSLATRGLVSSLLRLFRFQVHEAVDGQQALRIYSQHPAIELVVTDFEMPMMDGVELVKALRQKQGPNSLPIIGISGGDKGEISARFIKSGANDFLRKPFSVEEFNCRIIQCIESVEQIRALHRAATSDALTGLSNRRHFFEQGEPQ